MVAQMMNKTIPQNITLPLGLIPDELAEREIRLSENSRIVMEKRYVRRNADGKPDETIHETFWRVASNVASGETTHATEWAKTFFNLLADLRFLPNSPTFTGAGTPLGNLSACFVLPISDDMGKEPDGIFQTLRNAALIQQTGGGNGFSFSRLRSQGVRVKSSNGQATGPIGFLKAYDQAFGIVNQGGARRGANMGVLRIDHPNVRDFITCKTDESAITNFNISVAMTDKFMEAVKNNTDVELVEPSNGQVVEKVNARELFDMIAKQAHHNGEPGVLFIDAANRSNPIPHVGEYEATNPCGEQWLLGYESCNLGSINLAVHVTEDGQVDWEKLQTSIEESTRFLDDVVTVNRYVESVPQLREAANRARRIGLGFMGLADMMIQMNLRYGSPEGQEFAAQISEFMRYHAMKTSVELAKERGAFLAIEGSIYDSANLTWEAPKPIKAYERNWYRPAVDWDALTADIRHYGIRNAAQTTIAPTGTISTIAGCEGYGCEPVFALAYTRYVVDGDSRFELNYASPVLQVMLERAGLSSEQIKIIVDKVSMEGTAQGIEGIPAALRNALVVSGDINPEEHVLMQASIQAFIDNSISKTINMPNTATIEDVKKAYQLAWELGCKGLTVYVTGSRDTVVLETKATREAKNKEEAPKTITPSVELYGHKKPRAVVLSGRTFRMPTPVGTAYVTINENGHGAGQPFEVFINTSKAGSEIAAISEAMGRLISLILRQTSPVAPRERVEEIVRQLDDIGGGRQMGFGPNRVASLPDAIAHVLQTYLEQTDGLSDIQVTTPTNGHLSLEAHTTVKSPVGDICPECGSATLIQKEGCVSCHNCGYSEC